ncbi:protein dachsous-like [Bombina bombina]|uniref:protein dachsous-like n=1 Tax=Bombina bombina TaxID=8345 RepID=UPI00235AD181|nr:protein dachsous-like [Bombina bombina]
MDILSSAKAWKWQVVFHFFLCSLGWASGQLRYSIFEESDPGTFVGNIAQDLGLNLGDISKRRLHFGSDGSRRHFAINKANADLNVNERIDREGLCGSSLHCILNNQVIAENPLELFNLEIEILDINDNAPFFSNANRVLNITELVTSPGTRFPLEIAKDLDVGINGISQYRLNPNPHFSLAVKNRKDGILIPQLVLEKALDREENPEHILTLTAIDGGEQPKSGSSLITVIVLDINDNAPVFDQHNYKVSLLENPNLNQVIIVLNATDLDQGVNGEIEYSFDDHTSDSAIKLFDINQQTGAIYTKGAVDFEECNFYELSVRAKDKGVPKLEGSCVVQVEIEDANDNPPEIIFTSMSNNIPENVAIETEVGYFTVRDRDSGKNGEVKLQVAPNLPFKVKPYKNHYSLVTSESLDREKISQYNIQLTANDLGAPPLHTQLRVIINVSDVNDNHPVFSQSHYNAFIKENNEHGSLLCSVSAFDLDEGVNKELVYSIVDSQIDGSSVFSFVYINPNSGNIFAQRAFDYEHIQVFQITVRVEDSGSTKLFSSASVIIFVLDANDNAPTVLYPQYSSDVISQEKIPRSASVGYLVTKVSAVDLDSGHNAWLFYRLAEDADSSLFGISAYTGEIRTLSNLDDVDNNEKQLVILISDHGKPSLSTTVTITLNIVENILKEIPESNDFLTNSKPTSDLTLYLIVSLVAISLVSLVTFIILLAKCLKRENSNGICCSLGRPHSEHQAEQYKPTLYLNTDGTLKYMEVRMVPPEPQGQCYQTCFPPATETHDFALMKPLNFPQLQDLVNVTENSSGTNKPNEDQESEIKDMDILSSAKDWKWQVIFPFFLCSLGWASGQLHYSIFEESDTGTVVGNLARDLELNLADISKRRLHLGSDGSRRHFAINKANADLTVNERIDRESLCGSILQCVLYTQVIAENPLELFNVEIGILDINDNAPFFSNANDILNITELLASPGARFPLEIAKDLDVGINGIRQYRLNSNPYFSLSVKNRKDGTLIPQLVLEKALDREEKPEHILTLTAIDGGEQPKSGSSLITVIVLDINDNPPVFDQPNYKTSLLENPNVNQVIIELNATDLDEGLNGEIEYSFDGHTSDSALKVFDINPQTGAIYTKGVVDFEECNFYELSVRAKDKGVPKLEGSCLVQVEVEDANDNPPKIIFTSMSNNIPENAAIETAVGYFTVRDRDSGKNGEVKIEVSPNLPFKVIPYKNHYSLVTSESLDREKISLYNIQLTANDLGSPPLHIQYSVIINVSDINDNPPIFSQAHYNAFIKENNELGSLLCSVSAFDLDEGINTELVYSIVDSQIDGSSIFSLVYINPNSGNIFAQRAFDYEHIQVFQITVRVEDSGSPKLFSNASVIIFVLDANDNAPTVLYPQYSSDDISQEKIPRSASVGYLVTKISAVDLDSGHNAWLIYRLAEDADSSLFGVSAYTGEIRTLRSLDDIDNNEQQLVILISDHGKPSLSTTVTIIVNILENILKEIPKSHDFLTNSKPTSDLTLYLIVSLVAISLVSLVTFIILLAKCLKREHDCNSGICCSLGRPHSNHQAEQYKPTLYLNTDGTLKYMEVRMVPPEPQGQCYQTCFPPATEIPDFAFMKPLNFPQLQNLANESDSSSGASLTNGPNEKRAVLSSNQYFGYTSRSLMSSLSTPPSSMIHPPTLPQYTKRKLLF